VTEPGLLLPDWVGAENPRVLVRPDDIVDTYGDLSCDLMEAAGKPMEPWQREGMDLMLSIRPDGKWACYEYAEWVARQQGKGVLGEARVVFGLTILNEEITWSAHLYGTALIAFRRIREVFRALGTVHKTSREEIIEVFDKIPVKVWNSNDQRGFERLDTGRRIGFFARSKGGLRGASPDVNVIDEAFAYTFEQQDAIMPTLIAKANAQTIYLSSPPLSGEGPEGEVMFQLKQRAESGKAQRLGYRDWGIEGLLEDLNRLDAEGNLRIDPDDQQLWAMSCPGLGRGRVTLETIQTLRQSMSLLGFGREVLGLWPKLIEGGSAIDMEQWRKLALDPETTHRGEAACSLGVDIAPDRDYATIMMYWRREECDCSVTESDEDVRPCHGCLKLVDYRPDTDWLVDRIVELRDALNPVCIAMNAKTGASLKVELAKRGITESEDRSEPEYGDLLIMNATETTAGTGQFLDAVKQGTIHHIGQSYLDASIGGSEKKVSGDAVVWDRKESEVDTSPTVASTAARLGYESRAHLVQEDYDVTMSVW